MFTWICPKCGKEVPPSYSECPNCAPGQTASNETTTAPQANAQAQAPPQTQAAPPPAQRVAAPPPPAQGMPPWLSTILFTAAFAVILGTGYWAYHRLQSPPAKSAPQAAGSAIEPVSLPSPTAVKAHPVTALIEVTGLRLSEDKGHKAFVQFVVVNHSAAEIADLGADVNLIALTTDGKKEPVGKFAFKVPSLGPFESKDLKAPVDTKLRVYELPDWQFLRSEFQITSP